VLEPFTAPSEHEHHGQRVVEGQRLMQAAGDIFLGWLTAKGPAAFRSGERARANITTSIRSRAPVRRSRPRPPP
jgi:hypothetical protein